MAMLGDGKAPFGADGNLMHFHHVKGIRADEFLVVLMSQEKHLSVFHSKFTNPSMWNWENLRSIL